MKEGYPDRRLLDDLVSKSSKSHFKKIAFNKWCFLNQPITTSIIKLRYFNFEPSLKLRWCRVRDFDGSKIQVTTGEFGLRTFYM